MKPIAIKKANVGKLHSKLFVPQGHKITSAKIAAATKSPNPATRKQAVFAQNSAGWNKG